MNHTPALLIAILATCALTLGLVAFRDTGTATNAPAPTATPVRMLICEEDEDIVITIGENGLHRGFCQQVIAR